MSQQKTWDKYPNLRPHITEDAEEVRVDYREIKTEAVRMPTDAEGVRRDSEERKLWIDVCRADRSTFDSQHFNTGEG